MTTVARLLILASLFATSARSGEPRVDRFGDPLSDGAMMRLGTVGLRLPNLVAVGFRPSGELVALADDMKLHVWPADAGGKAAVISIEGIAPINFGRALSADARFAASHVRGGIEVWDVSGTKPAKHLTRAIADVYRMAFSPRGKWLAVSDTSRSAEGVLLADVAAKTWERLPIENIRYVDSMTFTPDEKWLTAVSRGDVWVIETATRKVHFHWKSQKQVLSGAALSPNGLTLAVLPVHFSGREAPSVELIDVPTGKPAEGHQPKAEGTRWVGFTPGGQRLLLGGVSGIREFDPYQGMFVQKISGPGETLAVYSADGSRLASHSRNAILLWDVKKRRHVRPEFADAGHAGEIYHVAMSPDGKLIATGALDDTVRIWSATDGRALCRVRSGWGRMVFLADSKSFIAQGDDHITPVVYDAMTGKELRRFAVPAERAKSEFFQELRLSGDGRSLIAGMRPNTVGNKGYDVRWDVGTGRELSRTEQPGNASFRDIYPLVTSPDERWIATTGTATCIATNETIAIVPPGEFSLFGSVCFADGRFVAAARWPRVGDRSDPDRGTVVVVDLLTRARVAEVPAGRSYRMAFSLDARLLATTTQSEVVVWDLATGKERRRFTSVARSMALAFTPDGRLITGHDDTTALVWDLGGPPAAPAALPAAELTRVWETLSGTDATKAYAAEWELVDRPTQAVALLHERVKPVRVADEATMQKLIGKLGSAAYAEREAATKSLRDLGDSAVTPLRAALKAGVPTETKARIERVLTEADAPTLPPGDRQRQVRAVAILARINNDESRQLLTDLAAGLPDARLTREAAEALKRQSVK